MNWLKVGAVVIGGIVVFFVVDSLIHVFLGLLTAIAFVAIVAGGAYVAVKIAGARKRRQVKRSRAAEGDHQVRRPRAAREQAIAVPPVTATIPATTPVTTTAKTPATPAPRHDVEDDLARLKREMGR
ncbi:MAG TPA: hypothetical protein VG164_04305 [Trebonia sp.]|jgi:hypothetical protein|nr:hypothetical protein [Trebonia sp.]